MCPHIAVATGLVDLDAGEGEGRVRSDRRRVGVWSVARIEQAGRVVRPRAKIQFLGVEMAATLSAPSLRPRRAACPTALGMARPVLHQSVCVPHPDRRRTASHKAGQSCIDLYLRYQVCTNMPRVQILSMPHSAPAGSNAPLHVPRPDALQCRTAAMSRAH